MNLALAFLPPFLTIIDLLSRSHPPTFLSSRLPDASLTLPSPCPRHVAYRDSKLTHLLKDSLGGNVRPTLPPLLVKSNRLNIDIDHATKLRFGEVLVHNLT